MFRTSWCNQSFLRIYNIDITNFILITMFFGIKTHGKKKWYSFWHLNPTLIFFKNFLEKLFHFWNTENCLKMYLDILIFLSTESFNILISTSIFLYRFGLYSSTISKTVFFIYIDKSISVHSWLKTFTQLFFITFFGNVSNLILT